MLFFSLCSPEDATLSGRPDHSDHLQGQPIETTHDQAFRRERKIGKVGNPHLAIRDVVLALKSSKRISAHRFLTENPAPQVAKLYEDLTDEVNEASKAQAAPGRKVWQLYFDGAS